jgi:hypothetical protein
LGALRRLIQPGRSAKTRLGEGLERAEQRSA